jgi:hypothetical protein
MTDALERIWAWEYKGHSPWGPKKPDLDVVTNGAEYIRADIAEAEKRAAVAAERERVFLDLTPEQVRSACLSYRHNYGLLDEAEAQIEQFRCKEWWHAIRKELQAAAIRQDVAQ